MSASNKNTEIKKVYKKRGRKPKGGKIVKCVEEKKEEKIVPNIILHIKCSLKDLENFDENNEIDNFQFENNKNDNLNYKLIDNKNEEKSNELSINNTNTNIDKDIDFKLKELTIKLHNNEINQKSACFWCTYSFDNLPIYIPKFEIDNTYHCYGCFCSPECATAYLFKEDIDSSKKFERYSLLNNMYCKIYKYNINIKPAPNPHYTLNKFYGNLTIQEYRNLLKNERVLLVVDKPVITFLPELYEDNSLQSVNKFKIRKKSKQVSKKTILSNNFNI
jgi:hypothetical protein